MDPVKNISDMASELTAYALYVSLEKISDVIISSAPRTLAKNDLIRFAEDTGSLFMSILKEKIREREENNQSEKKPSG